MIDCCAVSSACDRIARVPCTPGRQCTTPFKTLLADAGCVQIPPRMAVFASPTSARPPPGIWRLRRRNNKRHVRYLRGPSVCRCRCFGTILVHAYLILSLPVLAYIILARAAIIGDASRGLREHDGTEPLQQRPKPIRPSTVDPSNFRPAGCESYRSEFASRRALLQFTSQLGAFCTPYAIISSHWLAQWHL